MLAGCDDVAIRGIRVNSDMRIPNADGIGIDHCHGVRISDCGIRCPDDAIRLSASEEFARYGACENITVTNCVLETRSSALVLGVDVTAPIRNVVFSNCVITNSSRGLSLHLGQPSVYENVLFDNIVIETRYFDEASRGSGEPIYISTLPRRENTGTVRNIRFSNIVAHSENGVHVIGHGPGAVSGIVFDNVRVKLDMWTRSTGGRMDLRRRSGGPELVDQPTSGFYFDNAGDVLIRDSEVTWGENIPEYFGEALVERGSRGIRLQGFRGGAAPRESAGTKN
jgi:polygalacturonase